MNKKIIIIIVALIALIAIVSGILLSGLGSYSKAVDVGGITFHIPEDYELKDEDVKYNGSSVAHKYVKGDSKIRIEVLPNSISLGSLSEYKNDLIAIGGTTRDATIGGYSGFFSPLNSGGEQFIFEKNGAIIQVSVDPFSESDIAKIIS